MLSKSNGWLFPCSLPLNGDFEFSIRVLVDILGLEMACCLSSISRGNRPFNLLVSLVWSIFGGPEG